MTTLIDNPYKRFKRILPCGNDTAQAELVVIVCVNDTRQYRLVCCEEHDVLNYNIAHWKLKAAEKRNARIHHQNVAERLTVGPPA